MTEKFPPTPFQEYRNQLSGDFLFENSITAMMLVDTDRTIMVVNKQFERLFGYSSAEVIGKRTSVLTPSLKHFEDYRKQFIETREGSLKSNELQYKKKNGLLFWVKLTGVSIHKDGKRYILWSFDDISEEIKVREELKHRYRELDIVFNKVPTGLIYVVDDIVERVNPPFLKMIDMRHEEVVGKNIHTMLAAMKIQKDSTGRKLYKLRINKKILSVEQEIVAIDDHSVIILFHNVTQHILEKKELLSKVKRDGLTGLLNKISFQQEVENLLNYSVTQHISLAIFDIDYFKAINDNNGHLTGDDLLSELATLLNEKVRKSEVIGRIGGEEFAIAIPVNKASAVDICNRFLDCIRSQPFTKKNISITVSMGLTDTTFSRQFDELYNEADRLLYRAKQRGRNRLEFD